MSEADDVRFMRRALRLAARAAGRTSPNPLVGAVVVKGDEIVGEGFHKAAGEPHAEVNALRAAEGRARGATLYTTLEPCAHTGRTPPCVNAIREAGITRVVSAVRDPLRVVVDTDARTPPAAKVVRAKDPQRTLIFVARDADMRRVSRLRDAGVLVATVPRAAGGLDLAAVLRWLAEKGVNTVLSEAGPKIASGLVGAGLADRLMLITAPIATGDGPSAFEGLGRAVELKSMKVRRFGDDVAMEGEL